MGAADEHEEYVAEQTALLEERARGSRRRWSRATWTRSNRLLAPAR
ncbi:MAG: hypothetical protein AVDCRST_MAG55-2633 [uncultured Rubrobacteraceae bacterium]|uniref:Uncharacterized protein n=1 Tax=uncultured Rubrobacteraceae bacterium TaxID=349277 RepID=A0A6J4Q7Q9_9ACTN|nr:MAG: hypothetical protein AVDCRST_MAG55-2633 [uncultured Rubrobacteraceae bacterium]